MSTSTSTIVFTDVVGSTALRARLGENAADALFRDHERSLRAAVSAGGGRVLKAAGDGVMAVFDSATDAVRTAVALQRLVTRNFSDLQIRVGIGAGDVGWENDDCFGMPVVTAARLEAGADGGQIVVSDLVRLLAGERSGATFRPVGPVSLAGMDEPVNAFEVMWSAADPDAPEPRFVVPLPGALAVAPAFGLVGRDAEWDELTNAWTAVVSGAARIVLIGGEAGAGKTRLAFEFARQCADGGATVVLGACDSELTLPCQPWVQVLDQLIGAIPADHLAGVSEDVAELSVLMPVLDRLLPTVRTAHATDSQTERYRLFEAAANFLSAIASTHPLVVIIDDLQWADHQTLALLRHVGRAAKPSRLLIVATFRDTGDEVTEPLASCLADLRRVESATRVRLSGLDHPSVRQLVADAVGHDLDEGLVALAGTLADRSGGNAFYVNELWRHVVANGTVVCVDGRWEMRAGAESAGGVPDSIREVVTHRLAKLSPAARNLIELAAVAGLRVEFAVLAGAAGLDADAVGATLDELLQAKVLEETAGTASPSYEFAHAIVRETAERAITSSARARLHRALGEVIEVTHEGNHRPVLADLARHFVAASRLGTQAKALSYSRLAADQAARSGAYDAAVSHLQAALQFATPESAESTDMMIELGDALRWSGDIIRSVDTFAAAFDVANRTRRVEHAARAALGFGESHALGGRHSAASVDMTRTALDLLRGGDGALRIRLQASLARALALVGGTPEEAGRAADDAVAAARRNGDDRLILHAVNCRLHINQPDALAYLRDSTECCDRSWQLGDMWQYCWAKLTYVRVNLQFGRVAEATVAARDLARVASRERFVTFAHYAACNDVLLALVAGRFDDAEREAHAIHELGLAIDIESAGGVYGVHMFAIRREQGRLHEVAPVVRLAAALGSDEPIWRPGLAALYIELDMFDEARHEFAAMASDGFRSIPRDSMWQCCLTFLAEVCIAIRDLDHAQLLYDELARFEGLTLMAAFTMNFGPADRLLGGLAAMLGHRATAEQHFRVALELAERSGSPVWRARVQHQWVASLGDPGGLLQAANATAVELGMASLARQTAASASRTSVAPTAPAGLSAREVEVLALVAEGFSNREIGAQLFISQNTVANHVRAILQKTFCTNRAEASAFAERHGITGTHREHPVVPE
jgi:class 3 adenylate cyclase/DNA-binding CsgD family transcriptional regulator